MQCLYEHEIHANCGVAAPMIATKEAVLMMEPPPARLKAGTPCRHPHHTPLTLIFIV